MTKDCTSNKVKEYYDNENFDSNDVYDISNKTIKEVELFDYAEVPSYSKTSKKFNEKGKDDYETCL